MELVCNMTLKYVKELKHQRGRKVFSCCLPLLSITLIVHFDPFPCSAPLDHSHFPHSGSGGDNKGQPAVLPILIFASLPFYHPHMMTSQRLLNIIIDRLPLLFHYESSNVSPSCLSLIIFSFLPDILRLSFIKSSTFVSASSSGLRGRSRLGHPLE